jgi:FtsP/CotA-like multicopper oxidase with cupredoxin domain
MNGNPAAANWTALFKPGERVRLRLINASAMTLFDVRIPGLPMTVVQADGNYVQPVPVDEIRLGVAETYDVLVQPSEETAYTIFAQPESRGSYARGTLAPRLGMTAEIPPRDPYPLRTMADMGMGGMNGMNMSGMKDTGMFGMSHTHVDEPAGPLKQQLAGITPFPQPGPRTTRLGMALADYPRELSFTMAVRRRQNHDAFRGNVGATLSINSPGPGTTFGTILQLPQRPDYRRNRGFSMGA